MPKILDAIESILEKDNAGSLSLIKIFCMKCELTLSQWAEPVILTLVFDDSSFPVFIRKMHWFFVMVTDNIWHHLESLFSILQMHFTEIRSLKSLQINQTRTLSVEFSRMNLKQASINTSYPLVY